MAFSLELRDASSAQYQPVNPTTYLRLDGAYYQLDNTELRELVNAYETMHSRDVNCDSASKICCGTGGTSALGALFSKINPLLAAAAVVSAIATKCISNKAHDRAEELSEDIRRCILRNEIHSINADTAIGRIISIGHRKQIFVPENPSIE